MYCTLYMYMYPFSNDFHFSPYTFRILRCFEFPHDFRRWSKADQSLHRFHLMSAFRLPIPDFWRLLRRRRKNRGRDRVWTKWCRRVGQDCQSQRITSKDYNYRWSLGLVCIFRQMLTFYVQIWRCRENKAFHGWLSIVFFFKWNKKKYEKRWRDVP